jgi:hypothetical protein
VTALAVVAGVLIAGSVLSIPVLALKAVGDFGHSFTTVYAVLAADCALSAARCG